MKILVVAFALDWTKHPNLILPPGEKTFVDFEVLRLIKRSEGLQRYNGIFIVTQRFSERLKIPIFITDLVEEEGFSMSYARYEQGHGGELWERNSR